MNNAIHIRQFELNAVASAREYHCLLQVSDPLLSFEQQVDAVIESIDQLLSGPYAQACPVFARFFVSDATTQLPLITSLVSKHLNCALSFIQQPPLNGGKLAVWLYLLSDVTAQQLSSHSTLITHGRFQHLWTTGLHTAVGDSEQQTLQVFNDYLQELAGISCQLKDNCIRTWFYVNDIDYQYKGMIIGRNKMFDQQQLTNRTHFISSTGIGGRLTDSSCRVVMDAYAVKGLQPEQIKFLYAPHFLNRTSEYNVRFERGTMVTYGDRRQVYISGTASIDNRGEVVWPGDIVHQTQRMWQNVEALLAEADMTFDDIGIMLVYLRDPSDEAIVRTLFEQHFPNRPYLIVWAPVCRPGWLIEMECMGVKAVTTTKFDLF